MESVRVTAAAPVSSAHCPSTDTNTFAIQFCFPKESNFKRGSTVPVLACGFQQWLASCSSVAQEPMISRSSR